MTKKDPFSGMNDPISRSPNARPIPLPQPGKAGPPSVPVGTPRWKPDYSKYTGKKK